MSTRRRSGKVSVFACLCAAVFVSATNGAAAAVVPPEDDVGGEVVEGGAENPTADTTPASTVPVTTIPAECIVPTPVKATFVGAVVESDRRTARFQVAQIRGGSLEGYSSRGLVDVDFAEDVRFLEIGESYIVAVGVNAGNGRLYSKIRNPEPLLGSSQVVGLNSGVNCPEIEDAVRTLDLDGRSVESGVLAPMRDASGRIVRAIVLPAVWILGALVLLATLRNVGAAFMQASYRYWNGEPVVTRRRRN